MDYHYHSRRRTSSAVDAYLSPSATRSTMSPAASRPSISSDRYSLHKQHKRGKNDSDHRSIMSSRASETSQATRTSRFKRQSRPPVPPPKEITKYSSFTPAMTEEEDARSEMIAFKSKIRSGLSKIVKAFIPKMPKHSPTSSSSSSGPPVGYKRPSAGPTGSRTGSTMSPNHSFESSEASRYSHAHSRW